MMLAERRSQLERLALLSIAVLVIGLGAATYLTFRASPSELPYPDDTELASGDAVGGSRLPVLADFECIWLDRDPAEAAADPNFDGDLFAAGTDPSQGLAFKVRGIYCHPSSGLSTVWVEHKGTMVLYGVGDVIDNWRISAIDIYSVSFTSNGMERTLSIENLPLYRRPIASAKAPIEQEDKPDYTALHTDKRGGADGGASVAVSTSERTTSPRRRRPARTKGIDATVAVARSLIEKVRQDPRSVNYGIDYSPSVDGSGVMNGVLLDQIAPGSIAARYSLAPGDRIVAVNGQPIDSLPRVFQLYRRYRNSDAVNVTIERGGKRINVLFYSR